MADTSPDFTIGIEEEYLLVDRDSLALAEAPQELMDACAAELNDQVAPEFLKCQIEIGTKVCAQRGRSPRRPQTPALLRVDPCGQT